MSTGKRFVGLFDAHIGWEKQYRNGDMVTVPTHHKAALRATFRFMEEYSPQLVIFGGDNLNCGPVSHWHAGKPRLTEGLRLKDECELHDELMLSPAEELGAEKVWMMGNHEKWIYDFVAQNPAVEGMIEPHRYLDLAKRGWKVVDFGRLHSVGKLHFAHGDAFLRRGGGQNLAKRLVDAYQRNIRVGHRHTYMAASQTTPVDVKDIHTGILVPCLSTRAPEYIQHNPNDFMNGFLFGEVWSDGYFNDHVMVITDGKFRWNGKLYDGNKK